jgi:competence protein ComFC
MNLFKKILNFILDVFFPIECLGCSKEKYYLCDDCFNKITIYPTDKNDFPKLTYIDKVLAAVNYRQPLIGKIIHTFKFRFVTGLAEPLAKLIIAFYIIQSEKLNDPVVIPVPLHKKRLLERGFNQSELIAKTFCNYFHYPLLTQAIMRSRHTPHQVGLNRNKRQQNVKQAFKICFPENIKNKNIIIIDDVLTTGATLTEIAKVLKDAGADQIWALTVALD